MSMRLDFLRCEKDEEALLFRLCLIHHASSDYIQMFRLEPTLFLVDS